MIVLVLDFLVDDTISITSDGRSYRTVGSIALSSGSGNPLRDGRLNQTLLPSLILNVTTRSAQNISLDTTSPLQTSPISASSSEFPNFIRPSINPTAECNLWGLLCQTGLIAVGVNMTSTVTTTTVPCSYYLSAQAESASPGFLRRGPLQWPPEYDYLSSFGHSPECSAYAAYEEAHPIYYGWSGRSDTVPVEERQSIDHNEMISAYSPTQCGLDFKDDPKYYTPPGVSNFHGLGGPGFDWFCCGGCTLHIPEIRLLYFPTSGTDHCSSDMKTISSQGVVQSSLHSLEKRVASLLNNMSTLVTGSYTLYAVPYYFYLLVS